MLRSPTDLRLAVPALAAWFGAWAATGGLATDLPGGPRLLAAAGAATAAAASGALLIRSGRRQSWPTRALLAATTCLGGGLAVGALAVGAALAGPLVELAAERATVVAAGEVRADPVVVRPDRVAGQHAAPSVLLPLRLEAVEARGRSYAVRTAVVAFARRTSAVRALLPGQSVRVVGRLAPSERLPEVAVLTLNAPPELLGRPPPLQTAAGGLRGGLRAAVRDLPADERGLLPGLVVGDTSRMPADLQDDMRVTGLTHLTAVSGANLAIVCGFVLLVGRQAGLRGRLLPALAALAMAGFVVLARPEPSVVRAAAMGSVTLLALASGRANAAARALAAAVIALVLVDPWLARSYGFVLSALATGALVTLAAAWSGRWSAAGFPRWAGVALAAPLAAQLVCAPVVVLLSDQVSLVAVPANLLVAPAVAPATVLGVLATVASAVHPGTAAALGWAAGAFVWWIARVARWAAELPSAAVPWPGTPAGAVSLALVTTLLVVAGRSASRRPLTAGACAVVLVVVLAVPVRHRGWPPDDWLLAACDVGQGDALVLAVSPGVAVVVDAGPDPAPVDRCLRRLDVDRVPVLMLTHLHADHVEGVPGVLRHRSVGELQIGLLEEPADELDRVRHWASDAGVPVTRARLGDRVRVGPVRWRVLWPARVVHAGSEPNNASTVLLVRSHDVHLLLTGDVEPEAQAAMLATFAVPPVDVLKVAHHGSAYQDPRLLARTVPRVAVVSVGADNDYGHPAPSTLRDLRRTGALVARTDRDGTVVVAGSPGALRVLSER